MHLFKSASTWSAHCFEELLFRNEGLHSVPCSSPAGMFVNGLQGGPPPSLWLTMCRESYPSSVRLADKFIGTEISFE